MTIKNFKNTNEISVRNSTDIGSSIQPNAVFDFSKSKILDNNFSIQRNTSATYYDGSSVPAEQNLVTNTSSFVVGRGSITSTSITAPDGTSTAIEFTQNIAETTAGYIDPAGNVYWEVGYTLTYSIFAKIKSGSTLNGVRLSAFSSGKGGTEAYFDLSTGTLFSAGANVDATSITNYGNGWYRCSMTITPSQDFTASNGLIHYPTENNSITVTGGNAIYFWGPQIESRSFASNFIPNTTGKAIYEFQPLLKTAERNQPRFEHNPVTGESLGLLIEEGRTNLFTYSEEFNNVAWTKIGATIRPNQIIAPDGTLTGDKIVEIDGTGGSKYIGRNYTIGANDRHLMSIFLKKGGRSKAQLTWGKSGSPYTRIQIVIDLNDGTFVNNDVNNAGSGTGLTGTANEFDLVTRYVEDAGNGWYRCIVGGSFDTTSTDGYFELRLVDTGVNTSYTGDGTSGIFVWGAQLERDSFTYQRAKPTSYIKTEASQVTRNSEYFYHNEAIKFFENEKGSVITNLRMRYQFGLAQAWWLNYDHTGYRGIGIQNSTYPYQNAISFTSRNHPYSRGIATPENLVLDQDYYHAASFYTDDVNNGDFGVVLNETFVFDGVSIGQYSSYGIGNKAVNRFTVGFGINGGTSSFWNSTIKKIVYYPKVFSTDELITMSEA